jgi:hypothetical protein
MWLSEERDSYLLGLLRVAFAILVLLLTLKLAIPLWHGAYFGDVFHMPILPEALVPSRAVYGVLLGAQGLCCVLSLIGVASRPALAAAAFIGLYGLLCDRLGYHNNRYELLLLALAVSLTPCDRSWKLLGRSRPGPAPRWAVKLVGAQLSVVYLASSLGKLFDADWRSGTVLLSRFAAARPIAEHFLPAGVAAVLSEPWLARLASPAAIASELFLALGLWFPRTRSLALWVGVMFHIGIEIAARVELFSYTMLAGYIAFVTPELRERALSWRTRSAGNFWSNACKRLDLLARFQHARSSDQHELLVATGRDGVTRRGLAAWRELARAFPPLFPLWLPLWLLTWREARKNPAAKN